MEASKPSRTWMGTHNNPDEPDNVQGWLRRFAEATGAKYVCGQLEKGTEGTLHIQFYVSLGRPQRLSWLKRQCNRTHWEPVRCNGAAERYVMKEDTRVDGPWEFGTKPVRRNNAHDWSEVLSQA